MENKKLWTVALVVIGLIAIGGLYYPQVQTQVKTVLGGVSTLDGVDNPFVTINGQKEWRGRVSMTATSSVICSFSNPFAATSTVAYASAESTNVGIAQANNLYIATSTSATATTTSNAFNSGFGMGTGQWSYVFQKNVATTTGTLALNGAPVNVLEGVNADGSSNYILGPSENLLFAFGTSTAGTFVTYDQGFCSAIIEKN